VGMGLLGNQRLVEMEKYKYKLGNPNSFCPFGPFLSTWDPAWLFFFVPFQDGEYSTVLKKGNGGDMGLLKREKLGSLAPDSDSPKDTPLSGNLS